MDDTIKEENRIYDIDNPIGSFLYYVARPYSHTDVRELWKIESRAMQ